MTSDSLAYVNFFWHILDAPASQWDENNDLGGDGDSLHLAFAPDEWGMALTYYEGDYKNNSSVFDAAQSAMLQPVANLDLYNGNISTWVSHMNQQNPVGYQYQYDRLNRIKSSTHYGFDVDNVQWQASTDGRYQTTYTYDGNGNILNLSRRDEKGQMMDQLAYSYYQDDNNLPTNKLQAIQENASDRTDYEKEIKQAVNEEDSLFVYDEIGQLIEDRGDKTQYTWNVYNKLSQVRSNPGQGSLEINYTYDAAGNRVRKEVIRNACDTLNTFYVRDAQGNIMAVYQQETGEQKAQTKEIPIYGSDRLGMYLPNSESFVSLPSDSGMASRLVGHRRYELKDHLGNVRVVLSDQKRLFKVDYLSDTTLSLQLRASVLSYNNYYPFGLEQPEATLNSENYRYGFNGKENDREWGTGGLTQDYGFRLYNPGIAKFLSVDPLAPSYPWYTPYQFAGNVPISFIDLDGLETPARPGTNVNNYRPVTTNNPNSRNGTAPASAPRAGSANQLRSGGIINTNPIVPYKPVPRWMFNENAYGSPFNPQVLLFPPSYEEYIKTYNEEYLRRVEIAMANIENGGSDEEMGRISENLKKYHFLNDFPKQENHTDEFIYFFRGESFYDAMETEKNQSFNVSKIRDLQNTYIPAQGGVLYLTTQPSTARYFATTPLRFSGGSVLSMKVRRVDWENFQRKHSGVIFEQLIPRMEKDSRTETLIPFEHVKEFEGLIIERIKIIETSDPNGKF